MERVEHDDKETLVILDRVVTVKGRSAGRTDYRQRSLRSMVEGVFRKGPVEEVRLSIGPGFHWDIEIEEVGTFDEALLDMLDDADFPFNQRGELEARVKLIAVSN